MAGSIAETLTESFCERCGSRYTFESDAPKKRLRGLRVASRGLKTFVLDDKQSFTEAMSAARTDSDRESTSSQLDAFHKTFNFCMQCRQYTCPNCWNEAEGRCLTCAPLASTEAEVAPWDVPGLAATNGNGHTHEEADEPFGAVDGSSVGLQDEADDFDALARLDALTAPLDTPDVAIAEAAIAEPAPAETALAETVIDPRVAESVEVLAPTAAEIGASAPSTELEAEPMHMVGAEPSFAADPEPVTVVAPDPGPEPVAVGELVIAAEPAGEPIPAADADTVLHPDNLRDDMAERVAAASERTSRLFAGLRPGQGLRAALDAADRAAPEPEAISAKPTPEHEPEAVAAAPVDVVEQPTWPVADDREVQPTQVISPVPDVTPMPIAQPPAAAPAQPVASAVAAPQWPETPQWPSRVDSPGLPFLGRPAVPRGGIDALWAESDRAVGAQPGASRPVAAVQPCLSCGLSLSGTARFCRRCGSAQR